MFAGRARSTHDRLLRKKYNLREQHDRFPKDKAIAVAIAMIEYALPYNKSERISTMWKKLPSEKVLAKQCDTSFSPAEFLFASAMLTLQRIRESKGEYYKANGGFRYVLFLIEEKLAGFIAEQLCPNKEFPSVHDSIKQGIIDYFEMKHYGHPSEQTERNDSITMRAWSM